MPPRHLEFIQIWAAKPKAYTYPGKKIAEECICWGSIVASVGGVVANFLGGYLGNAAFLVSVGGLITAIGGLITSIGNQIIAALKIYSEQSASERAAKFQSVELTSQLDDSKKRIEELNRILTESKERIDDQHRLIMGLSRFKDETKVDLKTLTDAQLVSADMISEVDKAGSQLSEKVESNMESLAAIRALIDEYRELIQSQKARIETQKKRIDFMQDLFAKSNIKIVNDNGND